MDACHRATSVPRCDVRCTSPAGSQGSGAGSLGRDVGGSGNTRQEVRVDLGRRHGHRFGVRTLDTCTVACALPLQAEQFWTFDERQAKLAKAVGLKTS
jgi:hypothetical protein